MRTIEDLEALHDVYQEALDKGTGTTLVVRNRWMTISLIDSDEDGDLFFQRIPTDDEQDAPAGYVDKVPGVDTGWPLTLIYPDLPEDDEPCGEQMWSWDYFRHGQVDAYWMRCDRVGKHDEHENSETGARWPTPTPAALGWDRVHNRPADVYTPPEDRAACPAGSTAPAHDEGENR